MSKSFEDNIENTIIVSKVEGRLRPNVTRSDALAWGTNFRTVARNLGRNVAHELCELTPMASEQVIRGSAVILAAQEPPLPTELSWEFYDGVRDYLDMRRSEAEDAALGGLDV